MSTAVPTAAPAVSLPGTSAKTAATPSSWHVSPLIDLGAYAFSWAWVLIPMSLMPDMKGIDYLNLWAVGMTVSFLHRHYTLPYVYLDREVFSRQKTRFTLFAALLMLGFVASVFLTGWKVKAGFFRPVDGAVVAASVLLTALVVTVDKRAHLLSKAASALVFAPFLLMTASAVFGFLTRGHLPIAAVSLGLSAVAALFVAREFAGNEAIAGSSKRVVTGLAALVAVSAVVGAVLMIAANRQLNHTNISGASLVGVAGVVAAIWNIWHALMQKFGILRVYAVKSSAPADRKTPAWVDRFLLFAPLPFLAFYLAPSAETLLVKVHENVTRYLLPPLAGLAAIRPVALPLSGVLGAAAIATFVYYEWRATRLASFPRLAMGAGIVGLYLCFLFLRPVDVYFAYGFSHAVEYIVFVRAFLGKRYATPLPHKPLLQRLLTRPWLAYGVFSLVIGGIFYFVQYGKLVGLHAGDLSFFGVTAGTWVFCFTIWGSLIHFYFDGFLWKMRAPAVRAHL